MGSRARRRRLEEIPGDVTYVPRLRIVGTTWRERGRAYWLRRFWYAFLLLLLVAVVASPAVAGLAGIYGASHGGFFVALVVAVVVVAVTGVVAWRRNDRQGGDYRLVVPVVVIVGVGFLFLPHGGSLLLAAVGALLTGPVGAEFAHACADRRLWVERRYDASVHPHG